ncbi:MAG: trypsin-like peptidase domain-containing protein [Bacteroidales bacterium]|nr:trypsin-like peptidase domain-containing protein [Bacteroidales bacterium]
MSEMKKGLLTVVLSVLFSVLAAYGVVKAATVNDGDNVTSTENGTVTKTVNLAQSDYPDLTYAAEAAVDAVVYVEVTVTQQYQMTDPFFRFFFGDEGPQTREQQGSGSGVIIRPDGYIVTNNHVVANATKVQVTLNNNKVYDAKVIGTDPATDVALIKIDAQGLPTLPFGDSDQLRLGEWVLAVGSPLGYQLRSTITAGIVSAKGRSMAHDPRERNNGGIQIESFIQTDAAVNPGNSGGALVNKTGELVGINTAIVSQTGAYSGYSFAVPVNIVKKVVEDLIDFGSVKRAVLGIAMSDLSEGLAKNLKYDSVDDMLKKLKLSSPEGVYITEVAKGSSADKAGMKEGDVIVAIDGTDVKSGSAVKVKVNSFHPGDKAKVKIIRDGKEKELEVTFQGSSTENGTVVGGGEIAFFGTTLKEASKETLAKFGLKKGVEVTSVGSGKMLEAGASDGMVITYVNDQPVGTPQDVLNIAKSAKRAVYIEGVTANGRKAFFGFSKE